jgi:peptidoglycan/xylan/chitin deacetylase (PgdA/CDA1 family)
MKRLTSFLTALTLLAALVLPVTANAAGTNLLANASVENAAVAGQPDNWRADKWGTNTATLTHEASGHTGKSVKVDMTARTDGDAKWMADAVNVLPNKSYTYTSWYKANMATEIDLQYTDASGNVSYAYVQAVPASTDWKQLTATFTTPANAAKVSVMHIVAGVGTLQTDDFSLGLTEETPVPPVIPPTEPPAGSNLIANPSFETVNGTLPANWDKNNWGTNTPVFTYENTGRTGSKSAKVAITTFTNGDAKWFATPVDVTGGQRYTYTDWYKASVVTRVVIAQTDAAGVTTYQELATAAASATTWKQYGASLTVPATTKKVTIYHLLDKVGNLTLDDISLVKVAPSTDVIANGSVETAAPGNAQLPDQWAKSSWGTNTPTFTYENTGRTGSKSLKVTMANYTDGDAKWYFNPIEVNGTNLQKGKQYRFTTYYKAKAGVVPKAVAMFEKTDGTTQYFGMPNPQPTLNSATTWTKYSDTFSVPQDAAKVSVFLFINQNGWVQTDDYSITPYTPTGFNQPLLSLTFDDGHEDNVTTALPILNQLGLKSTQCFATQHIIDEPAQATTNVKAFYNSGHEICSHSITHPMMTSLTATQLDKEAKDSQTYLQNIIGAPVRNFATPYGDYNANVITTLKKYYRSHRTVDEGYNSKDNFDIYRVRVQNIFNTTTAAQVSAWIEQAKADKTWLVLVYHRVGANPEQFDSSPADFAAQMQVVKQSGITVKTYNAALDEITAQL